MKVIITTISIMMLVGSFSTLLHGESSQTVSISYVSDDQPSGKPNASKWEFKIYFSLFESHGEFYSWENNKYVSIDPEDEIV